MSKKTYTLVVSLASVLGLLITIAPLIRSVLEYRSPQFVEPNAELASLEIFILAKGKLGISQEMWAGKQQSERSGLYMLKFWERGEWEAMYEAAKTQHIQAVRSKALHDLTAYASLCALCVVLSIAHLLWARRLSAPN
ncbi:MAG: hypothetical protein WAV47_12255 [Blastocatellia bacterium]